MKTAFISYKTKTFLIQKITISTKKDLMSWVDSMMKMEITYLHLDSSKRKGTYFLFEMISQITMMSWQGVKKKIVMKKKN